MREYEVEIGGLPHTVQLTDDEAKARGLSKRDGEPVVDGDAESKARTAANKARGAANKDA